MPLFKFIIAAVAISFITSCVKTHKLSKKNYEWMPYHGNETLVFISNSNDADTIFLLKKDTLLAYPEAQSLFGIKYEVVTIFCKHTDPWPPDGQHRYLENVFVELGKSKDGRARFSFNLAAKDANFYRLSGIRLDSLAEQSSIIFPTRYKTYNDVYIIDAEDWLNFKKRSDFVTKLYWSKSAGLIRYDKQDGVYWELKKEYSL
jgi:hypothetical protein